MENQDDQQKKMQEYTAKVKAMWKQENEVKLDFSNNANEIERLNKKDQKQQPRGVAAQYQNLLDTCKFKLVLYFIKKKDGTYYTDFEIKAKHNRKPIPSIDLSGVSGHYRLDHEAAYNTLIDKYFIENIDNVFTAMLFVMDYVDETETMIMEFNPKYPVKNKSVIPRFVNKGEHRVFDHLEGKAIRIDKIRPYERK